MTAFQKKQRRKYYNHRRKTRKVQPAASVTDTPVCKFDFDNWNPDTRVVRNLTGWDL